MRWLLVLLIALSGCRRKTRPIEEVPAPQEQAAPVASSPATPSRQGSAPPPVAVHPQLPSRAGHPGEPANPAELRGLPEKYFDQVGSFPNSWQQLIDRKYLRAVPLGKNGKPLDFRQYAEWATLGP